NDLIVTPEGDLLVGGLRHRPFAGEPATAGLLALLRDGELVVLDKQTLAWPNGVGFSPDGRWLYAADFARGLVCRAPWTADRFELEPWIRTPSGQADGLVVD